MSHKRRASNPACRMDDSAKPTTGSAVRYSDSRRDAYRAGKTAATWVMRTVERPKCLRPWLGLTSWASESSCVEWAHRWWKIVDRSIHHSLSSCMRTVLTFERTDDSEVMTTWPWLIRIFAVRIVCSLADRERPSSSAGCALNIDTQYNMGLCILAPRPRHLLVSWCAHSSSKDCSSSPGIQQLRLPTLKHDAAKVRWRMTSEMLDLSDQCQRDRRDWIRACNIPCPSAVDCATSRD